MIAAPTVARVVAALISVKWAGQTFLDWLNRSHVLRHRNAVPKALEGTIDEATYRKASDYTLAKSKLDQLETGWSAVVLLVVLFSGVLAWAYGVFSGRFGNSAWAMAGFLF